MNPETLNYLLYQIYDDLQKMGTNWRTPISPKEQLVVTLSVVAISGHLLEIHSYRYVWGPMNAVWRHWRALMRTSPSIPPEYSRSTEPRSIRRLFMQPDKRQSAANLVGLKYHCLSFYSFSFLADLIIFCHILRLILVFLFSNSKGPQIWLVKSTVRTWQEKMRPRPLTSIRRRQLGIVWNFLHSAYISFFQYFLLFFGYYQSLILPLVLPFLFPCSRYSVWPTVPFISGAVRWT